MEHSENNYEIRMIHASMAIVSLSGKLRGSETRILSAVLSETLMQEKDWARITYPRLAKISGLHKVVVGHVVKKLLEIGYLRDFEGLLGLNCDKMNRDGTAAHRELFPSAAA